MDIHKNLQLMKLLNVDEVRHYICQTNKGDLALLLRKGETSYTFVLDSIPTNNQKELKELLYGAEVPQPNKDSSISVSLGTVSKKAIDKLRNNLKGKEINPKKK